MYSALVATGQHSGRTPPPTERPCALSSRRSVLQPPPPATISLTSWHPPSCCIHRRLKRVCVIPKPPQSDSKIRGVGGRHKCNWISLQCGYARCMAFSLVTARRALGRRMRRYRRHGFYYAKETSGKYSEECIRALSSQILPKSRWRPPNPPFGYVHFETHGEH